MSRYMASEDSRYDSMMDVSRSLPTAYRDDYEDSQTVAASSVMAPWSEYNTRLEPENLSPFSHQEWQPQQYAFNASSSLHYADHLLLPLEPFPRYDSPGAASSHSCSSSPSQTPPRPRQWPAVSTASAYSTLATTLPDSKTKHKPVSCGVCGRTFTGRYSRSNLARHERQYHGQSVRLPYPCLAPGCPSFFNRSDARLKHSRIQHPELNLPPVQHRQGTELDATSPNIYTGVGQWLQPQQGPSSDHISVARPETLPLVDLDQFSMAAKCVLGTLQMHLGPVDYTRLCDFFFSRWDSILQQLKEDHFDVYHVYAKVIEDIHAVIHVINTTGPSHIDRTSQRDNPRGKGRSSVSHVSGTTSQHDRVSKPSGTRKGSRANPSGEQIQVALDDQVHKEEVRKLDCPVYKYAMMWGLAVSCRGCVKEVMSQVRAHLDPRRRSHRGFPAFIQQCSRCQQDFIDQQLYASHAHGGGCVPLRQIRGDVVLSWGRLFLTLYPDAQGIPEPWTDATGWLPATEVDRCRASLRDSAVSNSFLDRRRTPHRPPTPTPPTDRVPAVGTAPVPEWLYNAALYQALNDLVSPHYILSAHGGEPVRVQDREDVEALRQLIDAPVSPAQAFREVQQGFATQQGRMARAAPSLTREQLSEISSELAHMLRITLAARARLDSPQPQVHIHPAVIQNAAPVNIEDPSYATPLRPPHQGNNKTNFHYVTPGASTASSSYGNNTGSSNYLGSADTYPSSTSNPNFLSPTSPLYRRQSGPALSSPSQQDRVGLRRGGPSRLSLPDEAYNAGLHWPPRRLN